MIKVRTEAYVSFSFPCLHVWPLIVALPANTPLMESATDQLMVFAGAPESPAFRVLGERPVFKLLNLRPNRQYQAVVYAENARGRSDPPIMLPQIHVQQERSPEEVLEDGKNRLCGFYVCPY